MSSPKKRPPAKGIAKSKGAAVAGLAFEKAKQALQDEKTQAMLLEQYQSTKAQAQQWREERRAGGEGAGESRRLGDQFGQGKLERRVENLAASLDSLASGRPELADALAPVSDAVAQLRVSVEVAGRLPIVKRKQAHLRIDHELDRLEKSLFDASFPTGRDDS